MVVVVMAVLLVVKEEVQVVFHRGKMEAIVCGGFVNSSRCVFGRFMFLVIAREVELEVKRSLSTKVRSSTCWLRFCRGLRST